MRHKTIYHGQPQDGDRGSAIDTFYRYPDASPRFVGSLAKRPTAQAPPRAAF